MERGLVSDLNKAIKGQRSRVPLALVSVVILLGVSVFPIHLRYPSERLYPIRVSFQYLRVCIVLAYLLRCQVKHPGTASPAILRDLDPGDLHSSRLERNEQDRMLRLSHRGHDLSLAYNQRGLRRSGGNQELTGTT